MKTPKHLKLKDRTWYGANSYRTNIQQFYCDRSPDNRPHSQIHVDQFKKVARKVLALARMGVVELQYYSDVRNLRIAFRFKSDESFNKYQHRIQKVGGSLGRGVFELDDMMKD